MLKVLQQFLQKWDAKYSDGKKKSSCAKYNFFDIIVAPDFLFFCDATISRSCFTLVE